MRVCFRQGVRLRVCLGNSTLQGREDVAGGVSPGARVLQCAAGERSRRREADIVFELEKGEIRDVIYFEVLRTSDTKGFRRVVQQYVTQRFRSRGLSSFCPYFCAIQKKTIHFQFNFEYTVHTVTNTIVGFQ